MKLFLCDYFYAKIVTTLLPHKLNQFNLLHSYAFRMFLSRQFKKL